MPVFSYKALGSDGAVSTGEIDASDRTEALRVLDRRGMQPVTLRHANYCPRFIIATVRGKCLPRRE